MIETLIGFYRKSPASEQLDADTSVTSKELARKKWIVFFVITFGYAFYYVSRLSFSVAKKTMADAGVFDANEMGIIGSVLFFSYAIGKLVNGLLADRVNVRIFMFTGLFLSAVINIFLGFTTYFWVFVIFWSLNGWVQSMGAPSSVVSISHWFGGKERGTFYGMWSSSHNIGEAITFVLIAIVISVLGWEYGFRVAGILCLVMSFFILMFLFERPEVYGLPSVIHPHHPEKTSKSIGAEQWKVFKNPIIWVLAFASAFFYVTRYAVNSWGIFFLEAEKGYSTIDASLIISANAIAGIGGTFFSGIISDKLFKGKRNAPALIFGITYTIAISLFVLGPANIYLDLLSMLLFGTALGVLLVYLGGLMAVDLCSKETSGTALGIIGIASYLGAGLQDIISGYLIEDNATIIHGQTVYDFELVGYLWIGAALVSTFLASLVWNASSPDD
jgi:OPA family sugar phosphate sensor protein UhpC-like MFS transporter